MMDEALGKVARRQWGVFSKAQAIEQGATQATIRRRLLSGRWFEVERGVYRFPGGHTSWHQKVIAATLSLPGAMASHRTAAFLWGLECFNGAPALLEVIVGFGVSRTLTLARVHHTRRLPKEPDHREQIPTTPLARTLVDLSDVVTEEVLFVAFDSARRKFKWLMPELEKEVAQSGGRKNLELLVTMLNRAKGEPPTGSPLEARTAFRMDKRRTLPRPKRQHVVRDGNGQFIARVDFAWLDQRVVVQCDSRKWHLTPESFEKDLRQRRQLECDGWRVLHITSQMLATNDWLMDLERLVEAQSRLAFGGGC
jgi:very-short-patch-repair endonuclease